MRSDPGGGARFGGTRDDPHRQARAARELPVLLHSMSLFRELFEAVFRCRDITTVIEVGVESGQVSTVYADLGATVYCVEPDPSDALRSALADDPRLTLVEGRSPDVLADLPAADLYVLDGDHNYATVHAELTWIMKNAPDALVVMNDVLWPCGRRDLYYQPSALAADDVHPYTDAGPTVWHDEVTPAGLVGRGGFTVARQAGGERNGVLTALEDAVAEAGGGWRFAIVPAVFGFGVLSREDSPGCADIFDALRPYTSSDLLANLENNRLALLGRVLELQYEAEARSRDATRMAETIAAQQREIAALRGEPAPEPEPRTDQGPSRPAPSDYVSSVAMHRDTWGTFLDPDPTVADVENLNEILGIQIRGGHRADLGVFAGRHTLFDRIADRINGVTLPFEDQCSAHHYFDVFTRVERDRQDITRIVDVGVFMGGSAAVFAGCVEPMGLELDLVDVNDSYLQFTYERLRRLFPGAIGRVRMFHGDLPTYASTVLSTEPQTRAMVHHDGAHGFDRVVTDLTSLYFVRDRVHSLVVHATHLRGEVTRLNFVDAAVFAVFGENLPNERLGANFSAEAPVTAPNPWDGNYFLAGRPEALYIPFDEVEWRYPHPSMDLGGFLPAKSRTD